MNMNNNRKLQCLIENKLLTDEKVPKCGRLLRNKIFVIGFPPNCTEADLEKFFSSFGAVRESRIIRNVNGVTKGFAFITFVKERSVVNALEYRGPLYFMDRKLSINPAIKQQYAAIPCEKSPSPVTIPETPADVSLIMNQSFHPHLVSHVHGSSLMIPIPMSSQTYGYNMNSYYDARYPSFPPSMYCSFWHPYYATTNPYISSYAPVPLVNKTDHEETRPEITDSNDRWHSIRPV